MVSDDGTEALWYRICIDDPHRASSESFASLLKRVLKYVSASTALVTDFEGIWPITSSLPLVEGSPVSLPLGVLFNQLDDLTQIIWGRFFLFKNAADVERLDPEQLEENIRQAKRLYA